ncbi:MAG: hypothetical protein IPL40_07670 [Proteobacteria bacterium]|nr:hypothetical protein [Pseudomonadota bacterium]
MQIESAISPPGPRPPLMGFNHNLRHRNRVYHVQTEDSGLRNPHVYSHVFFKGTIICSAKLDYGELAGQPAHEKRVGELMREQHKTLLKRLRRGELDEKIAALLGSLEPRPEEAREEAQGSAREFSPRIRTYRHAIRHAGRLYAIQTDYYAAVRTDVYHETILIASETTDCRGRATPGGEVVRGLAQQQHKGAIKALRDGLCDERIRSLLGALSPVEDAAPALLPRHPGVAIERYQHQFQYGKRAYTVRTLGFVDRSTARLATELLERQTLLTQRVTTLGAIDGSPGSRERLRERAQEQHKEMLRALRRGELDETIQLLEQLEALEAASA